MQIKRNSLFILIIFGFSLSCKHTNIYDFTGKWQSLNDPKSVVEFTKGQNIILYREAKSFWAQTSKHGELTFHLTKDYRNWYNFSTFDGSDLFFKGRIEIMNEDRIRIYFQKHHDLLDMADEYHRTDDFNSFSTILNSILQKPEVVNTN